MICKPTDTNNSGCHSNVHLGRKFKLVTDALNPGDKFGFADVEIEQKRLEN